MDIHERVGLNVRNARHASGLSQLDLVARLEITAGDHSISQAYLSGLENGKKNPTLATLWALSQALAVPLTDLVTERGPALSGISSTPVEADIGAGPTMSKNSTNKTDV